LGFLEETSPFGKWGIKGGLFFVILNLPPTPSFIKREGKNNS